jgi:hypothetical protein
MHVYRIGPARGAQRAGFARDASTVLAKMQPGAGEPLDIKTWDLDNGRAMLVDRIVQIRLRDKARGDGWYDCKPASVDAAVEIGLALTESSYMDEVAAGALGREDHARAMLHLRTEVFGTTQRMMAKIVGKTAAVVSRWEAGLNAPGLDELLRLRSYARALDLPWDDSLLLEAPPPLGQPAAPPAMETM